MIHQLTIAIDETVIRQLDFELQRAIGEGPPWKAWMMFIERLKRLARGESDSGSFTATKAFVEMFSSSAPWIYKNEQTVDSRPVVVSEIRREAGGLHRDSQSDGLLEGDSGGQSASGADSHDLVP